MHDEIDGIPLVEEQLTLAKSKVPDGEVGVRTNTTNSTSVVERVVINEVIDKGPRRLVVEKRLVLVEAIRIKRKSTLETKRFESCESRPRSSNAP